MVPHITTILERFTGEWAMLLQPDAILTVCREIGSTAWRNRMLTPVTTMRIFLLQIFHGNTAYSRLPHLYGSPGRHWRLCQRLWCSEVYSRAEAASQPAVPCTL
jgi:hypothetical protein